MGTAPFPILTGKVSEGGDVRQTGVTETYQALTAASLIAHEKHVFYPFQYFPFKDRSQTKARVITAV